MTCERHRKSRTQPAGLSNAERLSVYRNRERECVCVCGEARNRNIQFDSNVSIQMSSGCRLLSILTELNRHTQRNERERGMLHLYREGPKFIRTVWLGAR
jgi:hypothetical protein